MNPFSERIRGVLVMLAVTLCPCLPTANANDSTATLGTGGLVLLKSADIAILSEKLSISTERITVDYEMQNVGKEAVDTVVAFPLPRLSAPDLVNIDVVTDREHSDNFVNFAVTVDGKAVAAEKEIRAFSVEDNEADVTDQLAKAKILTAPVAESFYKELEALPEATQKSLVASNLLEVERYEGVPSFTPLWETQITYHWKQRFEPGVKIHVHHEYKPVVGHAYFSEYSLVDEGKIWCIDPATGKAITALFAKQPKSPDSEKLLSRKQVNYVLTTGANWAGPIRSFELTIIKDSPAQLISLCLDGIKKISPTQFKFSKANFVPQRDLSILFIGLLLPGAK